MTLVAIAITGPSLLTCRSLQPQTWPTWSDKVIQSSCLMAYEINKWAFGAQSHLMTSKQAGACGSPGPQAARQQGSKAARQQGSKAARQQGSKAARQQGSKAM
ncbi:hypothetical protein ACQ2HG_12095 [Aeromonas hydrophila]|uniref:hypothetical protein n=1 Tax=Aeromonas hydrophila TaxID=644 RepID=UPI003D31BA06